MPSAMTRLHAGTSGLRPAPTRSKSMFGAISNFPCMQDFAQCGNCAWRSMPIPRAEHWTGCEEAHELHDELRRNPEGAVREMEKAERTISAAGRNVPGTFPAVDQFAAAWRSILNNCTRQCCTISQPTELQRQDCRRLLWDPDWQGRHHECDVKP